MKQAKTKKIKLFEINSKAGHTCHSWFSHHKLIMSEVLDFDNGSESISDIIYESNMTDMELQAEDAER